MFEFDHYTYADSLFHKLVPYFSNGAMIFFLLRLIYYRYLEKKSWIKENELQLETIKTKIAYDMHQDIGNDLNALLFKIKNWQVKSGISPNAEYLQLENNAQIILSKVNEIVSSLKTDKDSLYSLNDYLRNYAEDVLSNSKISYKYNASPNLHHLPIPKEVKKNIYLLFKEILNNAIKHANASFIEINFTLQNDTLNVIIADNGIGFKAHEIIKGNGIDSMQNRIVQLNGKLNFTSNQPQGTIVRFELKI